MTSDAGAITVSHVDGVTVICMDDGKVNALSIDLVADFPAPWPPPSTRPPRSC